MPEIDISSYAALPPNDLENMRRAIVAKAAGSHDNLSIEDLHQLAAITGVLRRRASGPPKTVKEKGAPRAKAVKATVDDLA
jgi:hypothetical protein